MVWTRKGGGARPDAGGWSRAHASGRYRARGIWSADEGACVACVRHDVASVVCWLGTGIGAMEPQRCALQIGMALLHVTAPARIPAFAQIHATHHSLRAASTRLRGATNGLDL